MHLKVEIQLFTQLFPFHILSIIVTISFTFCCFKKGVLSGTFNNTFLSTLICPSKHTACMQEKKEEEVAKCHSSTTMEVHFQPNYERYYIMSQKCNWWPSRTIVCEHFIYLANIFRTCPVFRVQESSQILFATQAILC